jgi:predicted NAD/FAD-dependent oxidoreductase
MKLEAKIVMVHRWLYAQGGMNLENLVDFDERVASCGDWSVDGTVEGAFLSAMRLVKLI